jgi:hypothetical protein
LKVARAASEAAARAAKGLKRRVPHAGLEPLPAVPHAARVAAHVALDDDDTVCDTQ